MVPVLFHGQIGGVSVQLYPFQFLFGSPYPLPVFQFMLVFWRMPIFPLLQRLTDKSRIKGTSPAVVFLAMVLFSWNLRLQMSAITFNLILLLVFESNEWSIKTSFFLLIEENCKRPIPAHLIGKKDFSTTAFEGFLTLVKESRLPGHGVWFLVPSLSYEPFWRQM